PGRVEPRRIRCDGTDAEPLRVAQVETFGLVIRLEAERHHRRHAVDGVRLQATDHLVTIRSLVDADVGIDVRVRVDQPGDDGLAGDVDDRRARGRRDACRRPYGRDAAVG